MLNAVCCGRRALFGTDISSTAFAAMMAGTQALPWEGRRANALEAVANADARALIAGLLQCAPPTHMRSSSLDTAC
jgi:hypothetical protein